MRLISELWKDIGIYKGVDFEGKYAISTKGRVKNKRKGNFLNPYTNKKLKYPRVILTKTAKIRKTAPIHRLIAEYFIINPNGYKHINHKDENPKNFDINNLEWCTQEYNNNYGSHGKRISESASIPIVQLDPCGNLIKEWKSAEDAGRNGFCNCDIIECLNKHRVSHKGYIWIRQSEYNTMSKNDVIKFCDGKDKRIAQVDKEWNLINVYSSSRELDRNKFCESMVYDVIRGKREFYKGYRWMKYSTYLLHNY